MRKECASGGVSKEMRAFMKAGEKEWVSEGGQKCQGDCMNKWLIE